MIKLFVSDIDGTMTNGKVTYYEDGTISKDFNVRDGMGFELLRNNNIKTAVLTSEKVPGKCTEFRMKKLQIDYYYYDLGSKEGKLNKLKEILEETRIKPEEVAYIGDDINDLMIMDYIVKNGGSVICPKDSNENIKHKVAHQWSGLITKAKGGEGAVREAINFLIR